MLTKLTFKKAFGIKTLPADYSFWFMDLGTVEYDFTIDDKVFKINTGRFGVTEHEKIVVSLFLPPDERDLRFIHEIPTIDIYFDEDINIPDPIFEKWQETSIANQIVEPFIHTAFSAINRFIDSYRDVRYLSERDSGSWTQQETLLIPQITEGEFKTYLFYILEVGGRTFVGCFSVGQMKVVALSGKTQEELQKTIKTEIPFHRILMVKAWDYFFQQDFRSAVIFSATVVELSLGRIIRSYFTSKKVASNSQIDKFIDETSNRLLCTVILGSMGVGDNTLRSDVSEHVFEIRNRLIHGKKKIVHRNDAKKSLDLTEKIVRLHDDFKF